MGRVTAVLCAAFDPATDAAVLALRQVVREHGVPLAADPPHRPHFTLTAARVDQGIELDAVRAVAADVAARHDPIPTVLVNVGRFGRPGVLWLGPAPTRELAALQRDAYRSLRAGWEPAFGSRSAPALWIAHCTLATRIARPVLRDVQDAVQAAFEPIRGSIAAVATILVGGRGDVGYAPLRG